MNKLAFPLSVLAIVASIFSLFQNSVKDDLSYVDINKLVEGYSRTKLEREAFNERVKTLKANVDSLMNDWEAELKSYEKERLSMTKKELKLQQELLQNKQQKINNYQQVIQSQIQEEDKKMTQTIINDINDYVDEYGKKNGHRIILGAKGDGNIMYAEDASDLTEAVLGELNALYLGQ